MTEATAVALARDETVDTTTIVRQIAHELRQPLSTIESIAYYLDLILPRHEPRARAQLQRLQKLVEQSNWIVTNAVHFAQASPAVPQLLDLGELIPTAAAECPPGAEIEIDREERMPLVRLDPGQAVHLFRNLLVFFRHISGGEQRVVLSARREAGEVVVRLSSKAKGYSNDAVALLFEPFTPGMPAGSGLSLASVRRIIDAHHGWVEVDADPEAGVAIILRIPS